MTTSFTSFMARTAAVIAGLGLVFMSFAYQAPIAHAATVAELQAQIQVLINQLRILQDGSMMFNTNLSLGSSGSQVTALQNWLIQKGYAIPAGATGYFGAQTQSALARWQAANGVAPATGFFGSATRARVNGMVYVPVPMPQPVPNTDSDEDDAQDAIDDLESAIDDAQDDIDEAEDDNDDIGDANDILDEARDMLDDAEEAFDDEDYDDAMDAAEEGMDLVDEALDEAGLDGNNNDSDENQAEDAIDDLEAAIDDAQDDIDDADDDGEDVDDANEILDEARDMLDEAMESFDDEEYDDAQDAAEEGMDLVEEALDEANIDSNGNNDADANSVSTTANATSVQGSDNDYATFTIKLDLEAFGEDIYIPRDADDAFTYRIEDSDGNNVSSGSFSETISSSADTEDDSYIVQEDDSEEFTFRVTFTPAAGDGEDYRLQLLTIKYGEEDGDTSGTWNASPASTYETDFAFIAD